MGTTPDFLRLLPVTSLSAAALPCASLSTEATPLDGKEMEPLYVVPQGRWRPPMMTFREATSEGQSDDTQVKGARLGAGSSYKQDSQQWHRVWNPPPGAQSPPEGLPRARGQGTACWKGDAPRPRRAPQRAGDCTRTDRVTGAQDGPTALGGCFRTTFAFQALTGKQSSCSSKDTNLKVTQ